MSTDAESLIKFTPEELEAFKRAMVACSSFPFIDGIEDYIVEAILEYARGIDGIDPFVSTRSKKLYDVVDCPKKIGWSVKSVQVSRIKPGMEFELVIQRAVCCSRKPNLSVSSPCPLILIRVTSERHFSSIGT